MRWLVAFLLLVVAPAALAQDIESELRGVERAQVDAVMARDVDRLLDLCLDDVLVLSPGEMITGKADYARHLEPIRNAYQIEVQRAPERFEISQSGDLATVIGGYSNRFSPAVGQPAVSQSGRYVTIYRRDSSGAWKVSVDVTAPDPPPRRP